MRFDFNAIALLGLLGFAPSPALADKCDAYAADVAAHIEGVKVGRRTSAVIFIEHPTVQSASLGCRDDSDASPDLFFAIDKLAKTSTFDFVAETARLVFKVSGPIVREDVVACHKKALRTKGDYVPDLEVHGMAYSCTGSTVTVSKQRP